jgi:hypothetical protein
LIFRKTASHEQIAVLSQHEMRKAKTKTESRKKARRKDNGGIALLLKKAAGSGVCPSD